MEIEKTKRVQEELLDHFLEHEMERMEHRKLEIQDEAYLLAKTVGTQIVRKQ